MLNNREAYLCLSAMLRARESKLLSNERAERMLDAATFDEAAKLLTDCGYEDMSEMSAKEIEKVLAKKRDDIFYELEAICPDSELVDFFKIKYDYHNAKVLLKSGAMDFDGSYLLSTSGRITPAELKEAFYDEKYSAMPGKLGKAMEEASEILAKTQNPQASDFVLDNYFLTESAEEAEKTGNEFLKGYAKLLTDTANLKSCVRTMRMGKGVDFLKTVLVKGGAVDVDRIAAAGDKDALASLYQHTNLEKAAQLGSEAVDGGSLTEFELECDNAVMKYLKGAKLVSFGAEPVTAYLAAVENEITAVRMILTGRLAGVKSDIIRERLRDMYA